MKARDLALLAFALCAAAPAQGQTLPESPAAVADSFLSRLARKDFPGATQLVDSASMEDFKVSRVASARSRDSLETAVQQPRTDVPPAVAEWFEANRRRAREVSGSDLEREFGVSTVGELERMTAKELFAGWLAAQHPEAEFERMRAPSSDPRARELPAVVLKSREPSILGTVIASDSVAYALFHGGDDVAAGSLPSVLPVRLTPAGWRIPAHEAEMAISNGMCAIGFSIVVDELP